MPQMREDPKESKDWEEQKEDTTYEGTAQSAEDHEETDDWEVDKEDNTDES
jgi:hypothetical protein